MFDVLLCTVVHITWKRVLDMAIVAQWLKFNTGPRVCFVFSSILWLPYVLYTYKAVRLANKLTAHRLSRRTDRPTKSTILSPLVFVIMLETRTLKSTGNLTKNYHSVLCRGRIRLLAGHSPVFFLILQSTLAGYGISRIQSVAQCGRKTSHNTLCRILRQNFAPSLCLCLFSSKFV